MLWIAIVLIAVILLAGGGWLALQKLIANDEGVEASKYQMVFLTNGSAYFGKLEHVDQQYLKLTKVFYIQTNDASAQKDDKEIVQKEGNDMQLIKLGNEVYGPEDEMRINRDQVSFYGNIKPDGKVAKLIEQYKQ